jgi:hypothetical protein
MKSNDTNLLSCWPDGYSRYYSVSNILRIVLSNDDLDILDVGGDSMWMSKFLDSVGMPYKLTIVDTRKPDFVNKNPKVTYSQSNFFKLKTSEHIADAVINTDVLEHIPKELKIPFVNKCIDIATSLVIFSAPQDDPEVTLSERKINDFYKNYADKQQRWLKEHFEFGKPNPSEMEAAIKMRGYPYLVIDTNNLENWFVSFSLNFINSELFGLEGMDELNRKYNEQIHSVGDFKAKAYRKIYVVFKDKALFDKHAEELTYFFNSDDSKKTEFLTDAMSLIVKAVFELNSNLKSTIIESNSLSMKLIKSEEKLVQTKSELIQAAEELKNIKASKVFRYGNRAKRIVGR